MTGIDVLYCTVLLSYGCCRWLWYPSQHLSSLSDKGAPLMRAEQTIQRKAALSMHFNQVCAPQVTHDSDM